MVYGSNDKWLSFKYLFRRALGYTHMSLCAYTYMNFSPRSFASLCYLARVSLGPTASSTLRSHLFSPWFLFSAPLFQSLGNDLDMQGSVLFYTSFRIMTVRDPFRPFYLHLKFKKSNKRKRKKSLQFHRKRKTPAPRIYQSFSQKFWAIGRLALVLTMF